MLYQLCKIYTSTQKTHNMCLDRKIEMPTSHTASRGFFSLLNDQYKLLKWCHKHPSILTHRMNIGPQILHLPASCAIYMGQDAAKVWNLQISKSVGDSRNIMYPCIQWIRIHQWCSVLYSSVSCIFSHSTHSFSHLDYFCHIPIHMYIAQKFTYDYVYILYINILA